MNESQPPTTEAPATPKPPLPGIAIFLLIAGVILLVAAMSSKQWLEAWPGYGSNSDAPVTAGLFTSNASSAARFMAVVCFGATAALTMLGFIVRPLFALALGSAISGAFAASWWLCDERTWQVGRAYPFGMFALLVVIIGLTQAASATRSIAPSSTGNFVDGQKHGRWYVYDARGQCISIEEWEHGTLVSEKPQRRG